MCGRGWESKVERSHHFVIDLKYLMEEGKGDHFKSLSVVEVILINRVDLFFFLTYSSKDLLST